MSLKDFLKDVLELGKDDVFKVDVKESFSFFNTEEVHKEKILAFFTDFKENGRFVNVEISKDIKGNRGKGRSNRGDRRGGNRGFKKSNSRRSDSRNSDRSFKRRSSSNDSDRGSRRSSSKESDRGGDSKRSGTRESENNSSSRRSKSFNADSFSRPRRSRRK
jgi:ATP-dependent RNA helicase DeaD